MLSPHTSLFQAIAESAHGIEAWVGSDGRLQWINRSVERVTGYAPDEVLEAPDPVELLVYFKDRRFFMEQARRAGNGQPQGSAELRLQRKDGGVVWVALYWNEFRCEQSQVCGIRLSGVEIQARKEAELKLLETVAELRRAQALKDHYLTRSNEERARLEALLHVMKIGVLFMDRDHRVLFCNRPFLRIWGLDDNESLTGVRHSVLLARTAPHRVDDGSYQRHVMEVLEHNDVSGPYEAALKDGRVISQVSAPVPGVEPGEFIGRVWIYEDVTEQKQTAARLIELAERDPLTGLYNRRRFMEELDRMMADADRREVELGLLAFDLDGFKPINDRCGHQAGDKVLVSIAQEVGAIVRRNEIFCRVGGDEFAILVPDTSEEALVKLATRVCDTVEALRFHFEGREAKVTASLGIAIFPRDAHNAEELIAHGDAAMYEAKLGGKNAWRVYPTPSALSPVFPSAGG